MTETSLIKEILNAKEELLKIENTIADKYKDLKLRETTHLKLDQKLDYILKSQSVKIKVNSGGKIFVMAKETILDCYIPNLLKDEVEKNEGLFENEIFIDINPNVFAEFQDIILSHNTVIKTIINRNFLIRSEISQETFYAYLKMFFYRDYKKLAKRIIYNGTTIEKNKSIKKKGLRI